MAHIDRRLSDVDLIRLEAIEHAPSLPGLSIDARARSKLLGANEQSTRIPELAGEILAAALAP